MRRATERLQALQREADRLAFQERTLLGELRKLEIERQLRSEEMKRVDVDVTKVEAELAATSERMKVLQTSERAEQPELRARLVENLQARAGAISADDPLDARPQAPRPGDADGGGPRQARSRPYRFASKDVDRAEEGAYGTRAAPL